MIEYARDVLTVVVLGGFMLWCALHQEFAFFYSLFVNKKEEKAEAVKPAAKKFNGSAATWVK